MGCSKKDWEEPALSLVLSDKKLDPSSLTGALGRKSAWPLITASYGRKALRNSRLFLENQET